ncbi:MAG: LysM peptidoglycan-binding domain-containing protein [Clostridiales bacterium]|nr:LysM peptidoglycan-binding domain-containing protein [Clostridiales bacterium]
MHHIVQPGDSILELAQIYHTHVEAILVSNYLSAPEHIYPGMLLSIPTTVESPLEGKEYIVHPEESLYDIAVKQQIPLRELIHINHIKEPYIVYAGQGLILPESIDS